MRVNIEINGQSIEVDTGSSVLQAAEKLDIHVPRYCYHPGIAMSPRSWAGLIMVMARLR